MLPLFTFIHQGLLLRSPLFSTALHSRAHSTSVSQQIRTKSRLTKVGLIQLQELVFWSILVCRFSTVLWLCRWPEKHFAVVNSKLERCNSLNSTSPFRTGFSSFIFLLSLTWRSKATYGGAGGQDRKTSLGSLHCAELSQSGPSEAWFDWVNRRWRWCGNDVKHLWFTKKYTWNYVGATMKRSDFRATVYQWRIYPTFSTAQLKKELRSLKK